MRSFNHLLADILYIQHNYASQASSENADYQTYIQLLTKQDVDTGYEEHTLVSEGTQYELDEISDNLKALKHLGTRQEAIDYYWNKQTKVIMSITAEYRAAKQSAENVISNTQFDRSRGKLSSAFGCCASEAYDCLHQIRQPRSV